MNIIRTLSVTYGIIVIAIGHLCISPDIAQADPMSTRENFTNRPGNDFHHFRVGNGSCSTSCATIAKCRAYTYVISTDTCWLKDKVPNPVSNHCCLSGVKVMSAQEYGVDRPGSDIKPGFPVVTSDQCESYCKNESQCRSYTFVKPGVQGHSGMCWLKKSRPQKVNNNCCVSGHRLFTPVKSPVEPIKPKIKMTPD